MGEEGVIASDKRANLFKQTYLIIAVIRTLIAIIVVLLIVVIVVLLIVVIVVLLIVAVHGCGGRSRWSRRRHDTAGPGKADRRRPLAVPAQRASASKLAPRAGRRGASKAYNLSSLDVCYTCI